MKNNCDMARDLMPLAIDGVASEASQTYVKEHLEECEACRAYLEGMKAALRDDSQRVEKEREDFSRTAARMKRKRWLRRAVIVLAVLAIAYIALYAGTILLSHYNMQPVDLAASEYSVKLAQLEDGRVIVTAQTYNRPIVACYIRDTYDGNGSRVGTFTLVSQSGYRIESGELMTHELSSTDGYQAIRYGAGTSAILWTTGETITPASPEMEAYYKALDALETFDRETEKRHLMEQMEAGDYSENYTMTPEETAELYRLRVALDAALKAVPEWNSAARKVGFPYTIVPMG
ncbi:MAG: zf-HC2 domain-containing protein [Clostridia bacterium]|nr:zf-HC2 domain-containing protein [Clostridia bacterium]